MIEHGALNRSADHTTAHQQGVDLECVSDQLAEPIALLVGSASAGLILDHIDWFGLNHYGPIFAKADPGAVWGFAWGAAPAPALGEGAPVFVVTNVKLWWRRGVRIRQFKTVG